VPQGEGAVSGMVSGIFRQLCPIHFNRRSDVINVFDSCVISCQYFRMHDISLNSVSNWLSYDIVRFKIKVGVDAKCSLHECNS